MSRETDTALPIADKRQVRRATWELLRRDRTAVIIVVTLYCLAAAAGLGAPWLLGRIVDEVDGGAGVGMVDLLGLGIAAFLLAQLLLTRAARYAGHRFGERALARMREDFVDRTLDLPVSTVERAGTGDLMTRSTGDVSMVGQMVRQALPEVVIAGFQIAFLIGAVFMLDPILGLCGLLAWPLLLPTVRWYLRRARTAYLAEGAARTGSSEALSATASGAGTVEALALQSDRITVGDTKLGELNNTLTRTLLLRSVLFPVLWMSHSLPLAGTLIVGGFRYFDDAVTLGTVIAATLYIHQLSEPVDQAMTWLENLQRGGAAFARVRGISEVKADRVTSEAIPAGDQIELRDVHFAYPGGVQVLHGIDLSVRPGEHLAVVGPSGAGKSTLGRLLAGVDAPGSGRVTVGGVDVAALPQAELRSRVALVTQDHHVFIGTVRDNLALAKPDATDVELRAALAAVDADWVGDLPDGLDTRLGADAVDLDAGRAQQLALARLVLADPHTLILDEATSLLDPSAARHAERSLASVLHGRTVIAIAHRLHAAHDADRVAIVEDGRITELGSHDELMAAGGSYAALWNAAISADTN